MKIPEEIKLKISKTTLTSTDPILEERMSKQLKEIAREEKDKDKARETEKKDTVPEK